MRNNLIFTLISPILLISLTMLISNSFAQIHPSHGQKHGPKHGISMHGEPKYKVDFVHFSYVNPGAPKGGRIVSAVSGSYDSMNPFIIKGNSPEALKDHVFESLMARSYDEPFSLYGHIAKSVEVPEDRSWISFMLNPEAKFSDGKPITIEDIIFSYEVLREKGRPNHRQYYAKVAKVERVAADTVKFIFNVSGDREMPMIMGLMPVLPRHIYSKETFDQVALNTPIGSGPYTVHDIEAGKSFVFKRNENYWGRNLAVTKGRYNFDEIKYEYYRDSNAMFEAFKKGLYDIRVEDDPGLWTQQYDFPAIQSGSIKKAEFELGVPAALLAIVMNTRRPFFSDIRARQAFGLMFEFEWINKSLYHNSYKRLESFFDRSELTSFKVPADAYERHLLKDYPDVVSTDILEGRFAQPQSGSQKQSLENRRRAVKLLLDAGYELKDGLLFDAKTGKQVSIEILSASRTQEKLLLTYARSLQLLGIDVSIRIVDSAQFSARRKNYDFDIILNTWISSLSPGNEQSFRWGSDAADLEGSFNLAGVKSPAVDAMIRALLEARTREDFISSVRALDRVLLSTHSIIPLFYLPRQWVAHNAKLRYPEKTSLYGIQIDTWWIEEK